MRIKEKDEVAQYIREQMVKCNLSQSDLAQILADYSEGVYEKNQLKDNVSKWCNGARYPGVDFIYDLSKVFKVSIEEILIAGETSAKYDDRVSLYSVGKCCNENVAYLIEKLAEHEDIINKYDEYDKTLLDYMLQFDNIYALRILFNRGILTTDKFLVQINTQMMLQPFAASRYYHGLIRLCIKFDELDIFKQLVDRLNMFSADYPSIITMNNVVLDDSTIAAMLDSDTIYQYLTTKFVLTDKDWSMYCAGAKRQEDDMFNLDCLPALFNRLLHVAIVSKQLVKAESLLDIALQHNAYIAKACNNAYYSRTAYNFIVAGNGGRITLSTIVSLSNDDMVALGSINQEYRDKGETVNKLRDSIRLCNIRG